MESIQRKRSKRDCCFRLSYAAVVIQIVGIFAILTGAILLLLKWITRQNKIGGKNYSYYFAKKIPEFINPIALLIVGSGISIVGFILYRRSMNWIDHYLAQQQNQGDISLTEDAIIKDQRSSNNRKNLSQLDEQVPLYDLNINEDRRVPIDEDPLEDLNNDDGRVQINKRIEPNQVIYENIEALRSQFQSEESIPPNLNELTPKVKPRMSIHPYRES